MSAELACNRDIFSPEDVRRYDEVMAAWASAITDRRLLDNGIEFRLTDSGGLRGTLEEFTSLESRCCPFLSFDIDGSEGVELRFRMTGPPGTREFLLAQPSPD